MILFTRIHGKFYDIAVTWVGLLHAWVLAKNG